MSDTLYDVEHFTQLLAAACQLWNTTPHVEISETDFSGAKEHQEKNMY